MDREAAHKPARQTQELYGLQRASTAKYNKRHYGVGSDPDPLGLSHAVMFYSQDTLEFG